MQKTKFSLTVIILLFIGTVACSLLSGIFVLPAIVLFSALCIGLPSPILPIAPLISLCVSIFINFGNGTEEIIFACAVSIFYVFPAVLIAWGYFKNQTKAMVVINGATGIFMYVCFLVFLSILLKHGSFTPQILNTAIDAQLPIFTEYMTAQLPTIQSGNFSVNPEIFEEVFYLSKPLLPAALATVAVLTSYVIVCILNLILKKAKIIDNRPYRVIPHWCLGVIFILCNFFGTFGDLKSYFSVFIASFTMIFVPLFFVMGVGVIFQHLGNNFKNTPTPFLLIAFIILISFLSTFVYNLFYLIGAYYCVINGIKNRKTSRFKGGKQ